MSKDPALLFYTSDFLTGTTLMTHEQVGIYIRLLCVIHQHGGELDESSFEAFINNSNIIRAKFIIKNGWVTHKRLLTEMSIRSKKSSSLSDNAKKRWQLDANVMQIVCKPDANAMPIEDANEDEVKHNKNNEYDLSWPISYLNQLLGTRYSTTIKSNLDVVKARYSEGRTQEDFKTVIDKKVAQWRSDEKMAKYLRPETLFNRTKFESYLNELGKAQEASKIWPKHPKSCWECFGNGYTIAPGSGGRYACREKFESVVK